MSNANNKVTWAPRGDNVILEARLKPEHVKKEIKIVTADGDNYADHYDYFVYDKGERVNSDLMIGDEVFFNLANLRIIHGLTDPKKEVTYYYLSDMLIHLRRPGPANI